MSLTKIPINSLETLRFSLRALREKISRKRRKTRIANERKVRKEKKLQFIYD